MTDTVPFEPEDLRDVAVTDALLDQLGSAIGSVPAQPDGAEPALSLLTTWRTELDQQASSVLTNDLPVVPGPSRRSVRAHRRTAAATAIVVALAGTTGVAAAASGPTGPLGGLHKFLYGDTPSAPRLDALAQMASGLLDEAAAGIHAAQAAGTITTAQQVRLSRLLDSAQARLDSDSHAPTTLTDRLNRLRNDLASIPVVDPTPPAVGDNHGRTGHGADDTGTGDRGSTSDGQGSDDGSSSGGDQQDGGSSGSDDGTSPSTGGDGGSGSRDGSTSGDGSGDGGDQTSTGSGDGSTSGSSDGSTTSGGDSGGDGGGDGSSTVDTGTGGSDSGTSGGGDFTSSSDISTDGGD